MAGMLEGQVAFVTGAGRGIGLAISKALADQGAAVALVARSAAQIDDAASAIRGEGGRALAIPADVTDTAHIQQVASLTERELGPVTLLVNNAGTPGPVGPDWEVDADDWWRCIEVTVRGAFLCAQAVLPEMLHRGSGRVINVASGTGTRAVPGLTATSVAKTALIRFSEGLAEETKDSGVSVFAIHPGAVHTQLTESYLQSPELDRWYPSLRRQLRTPPELVGELCVQIATGSCDQLSGRFLAVTEDVADLTSRADAIREKELYVLRLTT